MPAKLTDLTPTGEQELGELRGLKRYLTDFSLVAERGVKEMPIWRELLTYAMLFGIADQVAEQMKELYPQISVELTDYSQSMVTAYSYHYLLYNNMKQAEERREQEKRSDGGGHTPLCQHRAGARYGDGIANLPVYHEQTDDPRP